MRVAEAGGNRGHLNPSRRTTPSHARQKSQGVSTWALEPRDTASHYDPYRTRTAVGAQPRRPHSSSRPPRRLQPEQAPIRAARDLRASGLSLRAVTTSLEAHGQEPRADPSRQFRLRGCWRPHEPQGCTEEGANGPVCVPPAGRLIAETDRYAGRLEAERPRMVVTRAEAVRVLLVEALSRSRATLAGSSLAR
jgi:hypothetical protein